MPLNKYRERSESEICAGCKFFPTKPEAVPDEILAAVGVAAELAEIERGGAKFAYPDALSPFEWASLRGLTRGKDRAETMKNERERREKRLQEKRKQLENG
jgi:hypothetical protein